MKSAMDVIWSLPNMVLTREKTRSDAAEEGVIAKMMRAAFAHVGVHRCAGGIVSVLHAWTGGVACVLLLL